MTEIIRQYLQDDIELVRGGDWHETIFFYEDDEVTPKDTTDWLLTLTIQKSSPNGEPYDTLTTDGTRIINTPGIGQFNLKITKDEIEAYDFSSAVYRLALDYGDGNVQVIRLGNIKVV